MINESGAILLDILYTHSLAEVGARTAQNSRAQDLREMAKVCRQVCERAGLERKAVAEAHYTADCASSPVAVAEPFLALLREPPPLPAPASRAEAADLLARVQKPGQLLSEILPTIHALAIRAGNGKLASLCEWELTGYPTPSDGATQHEPDEDIAHRVIKFYMGEGVEINPAYFHSGQSVMDYIRREPDKFVPSRRLYPTPLPTIERQVSERPDKAVVVLHPPGEGPGYADGDTFHRIIEGLRARLSAHLLLIVRASSA